MKSALAAAALGVFSLAASALALEPDFAAAGWQDALSACARGSAESVRVPRLTSKGSGRRVAGLERIMRWRLLKTAQAAAKLTGTDCALYSDPASRSSFEALLSTIDAASKREVEDFMRRNAASYDLTWEDVPVARLSAELSTANLPPGRYAGVCRPPAVFTEVDAPVPPDDATDGEKKAYTEMAARGEELRLTERREIDAFQDVLTSLEGSDCLETVRAFDRAIAAQRWAFLRDRDARLGAILRGKLKWRKLGG